MAHQCAGHHRAHEHAPGKLAKNAERILQGIPGWEPIADGSGEPPDSVLLERGHCTFPAVAQVLKVPPHVLKYELAKEGTTFRDLVDNLRRTVVLQRMAGTPGMTVEKMAATLGYRGPRQFYRRFKQWTGGTVTNFKDGDGTLPN